jgi:hypothetical protein
MQIIGNQYIEAAGSILVTNIGGYRYWLEDMCFEVGLIIRICGNICIKKKIDLAVFSRTVRYLRRLDKTHVANIYMVTWRMVYTIIELFAWPKAFSIHTNSGYRMCTGCQ